MSAPELQPEDAKLVTLARSARGRTGGPEGAAVRDTDGRTYLAASVSLPSLKLSALQAAVAAAVSSGVTGLEAVPDVRAASPDTRIVVYSQHIDERTEAELREAGVEAWLRKDEDLSELRATVLRVGGL